jgi:ankyrin repeat protein
MPDCVARRRCAAFLSGLLLACVTILPGAAHAGSLDDYFSAVKKDDAATVNSLLQRGLSPNLVEERRGETGIILALREDSAKVFDVLLNAPAVNLEARANNGDTALMIAAYKGNVGAVKALIAKEVEVNQTGWTALHYAAASGNNEIVQILLDESAYIDAESPNGTTPLMMAARNGHILTVKLLLDEGADATLKNNVGMDAIDFARKADKQDIVEGLTYRLKKAGKL